MCSECPLFVVLLAALVNTSYYALLLAVSSELTGTGHGKNRQVIHTATTTSANTRWLCVI